MPASFQTRILPLSELRLRFWLQAQLLSLSQPPKLRPLIFLWMRTVENSRDSLEKLHLWGENALEWKIIADNSTMRISLRLARPLPPTLPQLQMLTNDALLVSQDNFFYFPMIGFL